MREDLLRDVPHRQVVFTIPKMLRIFFRFNDDLIRTIFTREAFSFLLRRDLINLELVRKLLSWRHTGFNVNSQVRTSTKIEAQRQF